MNILLDNLIYTLQMMDCCIENEELCIKHGVGLLEQLTAAGEERAGDAGQAYRGSGQRFLCKIDHHFDLESALQ